MTQPDPAATEAYNPVMTVVEHDLLQEWFEITRELIQDLQSALRREYAAYEPGDPAIQRRMDRDMEITLKAEHLLSKVVNR